MDAPVADKENYQKQTAKNTPKRSKTNELTYLERLNFGKHKRALKKSCSEVDL